MTVKLGKWMGMIVILISGLIHLFDAPGEFQEVPYMGILFIIFFLGSIVSAIGIYRGELVWGWLLGGALAIGAVIGYVISRTVGMPRMEIEDWGPPLAYLSILLEIIYFVPFLASNRIYFKRAL
jgi:hypothetical protein